ncbi:hypothetical protein [Parasphingorhabdus sp.]|uniref:hypothetical protein n=1 Tax=Parasphingorhabdus sp. TaxID=2709688 RepID=UPI003D26AF10
MTAAITSAVIMGTVCGLSAVGGAALKFAADKQSYPMLGASLCIYSAASLLLFWLYRSGAATSFALTTFTALLGSLLATQIISTILFHEPVNWRAFTVLALAIVAFVWAIQPATDAPNISNPTLTHGENL